MSDSKTSGEIVVGLLQEVRADCKTLTAGQATIQRTLDAGERRMDDLDKRLSAVEKTGCQRLGQHQQAVQKTDDDSDWSKPAKHKNQREIKTEPITKKLDMGLWVKIGWIVGAAAAGYFAASKGGVTP